MKNIKLVPECIWLDAKRVFHQFTLGRSVLARLEREGKIRSCSLRDVGKKHGKKLYNVESINNFLNSLVNQGGESAS